MAMLYEMLNILYIIPTLGLKKKRKKPACSLDCLTCTRLLESVHKHWHIGLSMPGRGVWISFGKQYHRGWSRKRRRGWESVGVKLCFGKPNLAIEHRTD